jgi:hypothetical protein
MLFGPLFVRSGVEKLVGRFLFFGGID